MLTDCKGDFPGQRQWGIAKGLLTENDTIVDVTPSRRDTPMAPLPQGWELAGRAEASAKAKAASTQLRLAQN